jgi:putative oxidoreductase
MKRGLFWASLAILSVAFTYAGGLKIANPRAFQDAILDYQVVGVAPAAALAWWLPWFEVVCALCLWWPRFRRAGLAGISLMVVGFLAILMSAVARGLSISCGCFGASGHDLWVAIAIDMILLMACVCPLLVSFPPVRGPNGH